MRRWAAVVGMVAGLAGVLDAQTPTRIRLGTLAPQGTSYHRILQEMGEQLRTRTNGSVQLTVYAGTMGSELEIVRRLRLGQLQAGALTVVGLREIDPAVSALAQILLMFHSLDESEWVRERLAPDLATRLADKGVVVLFWADAGWVRYFTSVPVAHPDEFKKLKIFVTAGDNLQFDMMKSSGYTPVSLEYSDALTALQTGMIDAVPTVPLYALAGQYATVAKYMLEVNWVPLAGATVINKKTYDALTPAERTALHDVAATAGPRFQTAGREEGDSAVAAMKRRGLTVVAPGAASEWKAMAEGFYPKIRGRMVPADMFDEVVKLVAEYRSTHPGK
ncbi:MAG: C4-dicarboxylate ABC transporter substrate-binding protein [Gemmatimonadetes bacterium]|nr:C4-dicarboxylate ABC transporter substrate-binding protein [Gemmatimonadota bacterium]